MLAPLMKGSLVGLCLYIYIKFNGTNQLGKKIDGASS